MLQSGRANILRLLNKKAHWELLELQAKLERKVQISGKLKKNHEQWLERLLGAENSLAQLQAPGTILAPEVWFDYQSFISEAARQLNGLEAKIDEQEKEICKIKQAIRVKKQHADRYDELHAEEFASIREQHERRRTVEVEDMVSRVGKRVV